MTLARAAVSGGLFDPLGMEPGPGGRRAPLAAWLAGALIAALGVLFGVAWLRDDGSRGRPVAVAPIGHSEAQPKPPTPVPPPPPGAPPSPPAAASPAAPPDASAVRDDQEVEIQNGVRIIRPRRSSPGTAGSRTVPVDPSGAAR